MRTIIAVTAAAMALSFSAAAGQAGGWGYKSNSRHSSGLVNVSPSVRTGNVGVLNGVRILNNSPIASGNVVSGILSGNQTGIGVLGTGNSVLKGLLGGGGKDRKNKKRR